MTAKDEPLSASKRADRGMCPCSHCGINACPLAIMVINNRKFLLDAAGIKPTDDKEATE